MDNHPASPHHPPDALHRAIDARDVSALAALLAAGFPPNSRDPGPRGGGTPPLSHAMEQGFDEAARLLLDAGADPNACDDNGWTPAFYAVRYGRADFLQSLLLAGADPNASDADQGSALTYAAWHGHAGCAKILLEHGADPQKPGRDNDTPFRAAARAGRIEILEMFIRLGCNPNAPSPAHCRTPILEALSHGHKDAANFMKDLFQILESAKPSPSPDGNIKHKSKPL